MFLPPWFDGVAADVGVVAAIVVGVGVIYRGVIRPVVRYGRRVEATIQDVQGQFRNNGGTTMRDAIDRIDERTSSLEAWRESVDARLPATPTPKPAPRTRKKDA